MLPARTETVLTSLGKALCLFDKFEVRRAGDAAIFHARDSSPAGRGYGTAR
jgi:hypothetical protein